MKGIIIYSSITGNTERMAQYLYSHLSNDFDMDIFSDKEKLSFENYDFALLGAWCHKEQLCPAIMKVFNKANINNIGFFGTIGAGPDCQHGQNTINNIAKALENKNSLGVYLCPGTVSEKMKKVLKSKLSIFIPKSAREAMQKTADSSRQATEEELFKAYLYFKDKITLNLNN